MLTPRTAPSRPRRQSRKGRRWALLLPILALVASGRQGHRRPGHGHSGTHRRRQDRGPQRPRPADRRVDGDHATVPPPAGLDPSRTRLQGAPAGRGQPRPHPGRLRRRPARHRPAGIGQTARLLSPAALPGRRTSRKRERADAATTQRGDIPHHHSSAVAAMPGGPPARRGGPPTMTASAWRSTRSDRDGRWDTASCGPRRGCRPRRSTGGARR
jgi:hypothetical protein